MNAPDSSATPEPRVLSEPRVARLREAIVLRLREPSGPDDDLRAVLQEVADEARSNSLRPETLIVALKSVMADIEPGRTGRNPDEQRRLHEWIVTTCIRAYFDPSRRTSDPS